ncbi:MAG: hypothetical protein RLZZ196_3074 [Bacteroidota bacterium]
MAGLEPAVTLFPKEVTTPMDRIYMLNQYVKEQCKYT